MNTSIFADLEIGTKIWNSAWPATTYLVITELNNKAEARALQQDGNHPPYLKEPTVRKIILHQEFGETTQEENWITNQTALLDQNWTLTEPKADA